MTGDPPGRRPRAPEGLGIEGYEGAALIGEGGFASVYRARQPAFDRLVAVKVLSKVQLDERALRQFDRERASIGSLSSHPNIVTVYESGVTGAGLPYLAMEYLPRGSLADRVAREGPLPWPEVAHIGVRLAGALETAHQAGILHRDVKPENVLMSSFGEPQLTDFGIARVLAAPETRTVNQAVSVAHAAPEVLNGERFSRQSDIYSLGSTLVTLLWGTPPFLRDDDELLLTLLVRIATVPPPDLRAHGVPDALCRTLERAMAKLPDLRHGTALQLAEELQQGQAGADIVATIPFVATALPFPGTRPVPGAGDRPTPVAARSATVTLLPPAPAPRSRRRVRSLRWGLPLAAATIMGVVVLVATLHPGDQRAGAPGSTDTTAPGATTTTVVTTTTTRLAAVSFPDNADALKAGRYAPTSFASPFEFDLPEGWRATSTGIREQLELVRSAGGATSVLTFLHVSRVVDPQLAPAVDGDVRSAARSAPGDLVQWLRTHPRLMTGEATPATDGALAGTSLDLQASLGYTNSVCGSARPGRRCVLLFVNADGFVYAVPEGYRVRLHVLRLGPETLVAAIEAPVAEFDGFAPDAERVLATLGPPA